MVLDQNHSALYFSRSPIPYQVHKDTRNSLASEKKFLSEQCLKHQGLYGYTGKALEKISGFSKAKLEETEGLEQLRMLYHGMKILIHKTKHDSIGVDHPKDIHIIEKILSKEGEWRE